MNTVARHANVPKMFKRITSLVKPFQFHCNTHLLNSLVSMANNDLKLSTLENSTKKIGTHDGVFHCDEVLACYMLKTLPEYADAEIVRSRNPEILATCDIVVDVGSEFIPDKLRFDHHQATFAETLSSLRPEFGENWNIRLSSAGLIYVFYGHEVIRNILKNRKSYEITDESLKVIFTKVYEQFIREIDGIDNGVPMFDGEPNYTINTHLSSRISNLNPSWNEKSDDIESRFNRALQLVGETFCDKVFCINNIGCTSIMQHVMKNIFSSGILLYNVLVTCAFNC